MSMPLRIAYRVFEPFGAALQQQAAAFGLAADEFDAEPFDLGRLHDELVRGDRLRTGEFDLVMLNTDWIPEAIDRGVIADLSPSLAALPPDDWPDGWAPAMRGLTHTPDGRCYGLAYHDGPIVLMYRGDLFDHPDEQARFADAHGRPLTPPTTWDEFVEVATWFNRPADGLYGATLAGFPDDHNNVYDFLLLLWSAGGRFLSADRTRAAFGGPEGHWALRYYGDLLHRHGVVPADCVQHDSVASGNHYAAGKAAMMWNWIGFSVVTELPSSAIRGSNRVALVPRHDGRRGEHTTLNVFWVLAVAAGSRQPARAYEFMRHTASAAMDKVTSMSGGNGVRLSTWNDPEVRARFPSHAILEDAHRASRTLPALVSYPRLAAVIGEMTRSVLHDGADPVAALATAVDRVDAILADEAV